MITTLLYPPKRDKLLLLPLDGIACKLIVEDNITDVLVSILVYAVLPAFI